MVAVRPFRFTGLPSYTTEQVAFQESLATYLSYEPFTRRFRKSLAEVLGGYLQVACRISKGELHPVSRADLDAVMPAVGCIVVVGASPTEHKLLVDLDPSLAAFCIERLLGGSGDTERIRRPLTEIEEGVLSFILLRALDHFQNGWRTGRELALSLDRFASNIDDIRNIAESESGYEMVGFRIGVGKRVGYARIFIPNNLITKAFTTPPSQTATTEEELLYMRRVFRGLGQRQVLGRVQLARLDLRNDDLAQLERGDIIILEDHQVQKTPHGIEGTVFMRVGSGQNGGIVGRLLNEGDTSRLQILEIIQQEKPLEAPMPDEDDVREQSEAAMADERMADDVSSAAEDDDNFQETEGLLRDVDAPVVVELGRLKMNTAQVVRLRPGQILRLPRGPNDPVDLVVSGKLFARGELVEVEGELGVRLLQVVGAS